MAYLQTNVPTDSASGPKDNYNLQLTNNGSTYTSAKATSSTEMIYKATSSSSDYTMRIYKSSGQSASVKYGYAWSTDGYLYYPSTEMDGAYYLKNYNSGLYLSLNSSDSKAYQSSFDNINLGTWNLWLSSSTSYWLKNLNTSNTGLGFGNTISSNNYYAIDGSTSSITDVTLQFNESSGTYTFMRTLNGVTYALGILDSSTSENAYACWRPYSSTNKSQKWYLETVNIRTGDVNVDGSVDTNDITMLNQYLAGSVSFSNNYRSYMADVNKDGSIDTIDRIILYRIINGL
jgi:hypothetical protein